MAAHGVRLTAYGKREEGKEEWKDGMMEGWGGLEDWKSGMVEGWNSGMMGGGRGLGKLRI
jgi:hypothetical protein